MHRQISPVVCFLAACHILSFGSVNAEPTPTNALPIKAGTALHVLSIGVEPDESELGKNDPYAQDAKHIASAMEAAKRHYTTFSSRVLAGKDADKAAVLAALEDLKKTMRDGDVALIHFSTHGDFTEDKDSEFVFSLALTERGKDDPDLSNTEFNNIVALIKGTVLVSLDTCCAAGIFPKKPIGNVSYLVASGREESSYGEGSGRKRPHGYYIRVFLEALKGGADADKNGRVTFGELADYLPAKAAHVSPEQNAEFRIHDAHRATVVALTD